MNLRMPQNLSTNLRVETGQQVLFGEIAAEQASALGRNGRNVERILERLKVSSPSQKSELMDEAAEAVWNYFVQREVMGFSDHDQVIAHYGIPGDVLARVGSKRRP